MIGPLDEFFEMLEMKEKGPPIATSTTYTLVKSLEQKGFIEASGTRVAGAQSPFPPLSLSHELAP